MPLSNAELAEIARQGILKETMTTYVDQAAVHLPGVHDYPEFGELQASAACMERIKGTVLARLVDAGIVKQEVLKDADLANATLYHLSTPYRNS